MRDPLAGLVDAPLFIVPRVLDGLRTYRAGSPSALIGALVDTLLAGIEAHPTRFWVMKQFQKTLEAAGSDDAHAREQLRKAFDTLMDILGIDSAHGLPGLQDR